MKPKFHYEIFLEFELSQAEVDLLVLLSEHHYDATCRMTAQSGGFLNGIRNVQKLDSTPTHTLNFRQIDTLCKLLEGRPQLKFLVAKRDRSRWSQYADALEERLHGYLHDINAEIRRLNPLCQRSSHEAHA